ncbi:MAG: hypothetical protein FJ109_07775 [Deltaproteobacteria bacterium]|nr:hypothetical protein [Deltaproteobacteria bacterium]
MFTRFVPPYIERPPSGGPGHIPSLLELWMAATGWTPPPMPPGPFPDPPPISVYLKTAEPIMAQGVYPFPFAPQREGYLDTGMVYSGGLAQVTYHLPVETGVDEEFNLYLETSPTPDGNAFIEVVRLTHLVASSRIEAGTIQSTWFGHLGSGQVARYLRWRMDSGQADPPSSFLLNFSVLLELRPHK